MDDRKSAVVAHRKALVDLLVDHVKSNPGQTNAEIAAALGLESSYEGGQRNYLSFSLLSDAVGNGIGHLPFKHDVADWEGYIGRMGKLDWRKSGELWQGNIIREGKVMTRRVPLRLAVQAVRNAIGLTDQVLGITDSMELTEQAA